MTMIDPKEIDIHRLRWDPLNVGHIAREGHEVTPQEVEYITFSEESIMRYVRGGRILILGPTHNQRILAAVLDPEGEGVWYCVSARSASRKERELYHQERARRNP